MQVTSRRPDHLLRPLSRYEGGEPAAHPGHMGQSQVRGQVRGGSGKRSGGGQVKKGQVRGSREEGSGEGGGQMKKGQVRGQEKKGQVRGVGQVRGQMKENQVRGIM